MTTTPTRIQDDDDLWHRHEQDLIYIILRSSDDPTIKRYRQRLENMVKATYHSQICDFIDGVIELVNDQPGWASRRERVAQYEQEVFVDETNANHDIDDLISLPNTNNVTKRSLRDG